MRAVFLCGPGRSGTTVLRRALGRHPDVAALAQEARFVVDPGGLLDLHEALDERWDPYVADDALWRAWASSELLERLGVRRDPNRAWCGIALPDRAFMFRISPADRSEVLRRFAEDTFRARSGRPSATHLVDDTPYAGLHAHRISRVFPDAAFVHCVRHPLDVLASHLRGNHAWTAKEPRAAAETVRDVMARTRLRLLRVSPTAAVTVRVEKVVANPRRAMLDLCARLGLSTGHEASMAEEYDARRARIGRRRELTGGELAAARHLLSPVCKTWGYEVDV